MVESLIQMSKDAGAKAFVFVSSSMGTGKERLKNPLTSDVKVAFLRKMFPAGVDFVDTATCEPRCGGPLAAFSYLKERGFTDISLVGGSDRAIDFGPSGRMWEGVENPPTFVAIQRDASDVSKALNPSLMSGTKARALVADGDLEGFTRAVTWGNVTQEDAKQLFDLLRVKRGGGDIVEDSTFDADYGGRRRKTRRAKRNKASGKALYRRGSQSRNGSSKTNRSSYVSRGYSRDSSTL